MGRAFEWVRETPDAGTMKKSDRVAIWGVICVLVLLVAIEIVMAVRRVIEIAAGPPVTVELPLIDTPIDDLEVEANATRADVSLTWIDGGERTWLIVQQLSGALSWLVLTTCIVVFLSYVARRIPFPPRVPLLLAAGGMAYLVFQGVALMARTMALGAISARLGVGNVSADVDFLRLLVVPVVLISIAYVLGAGQRIQKDTEGLV